MCAKTFLLISICLIFLDTRKKVDSMMKDELNSEIIEEFVALKAKMYLVKTKKAEMKQPKGVKKEVGKKKILAIKTL